MCAPAPASHGLIFQHVEGKGGRGEPPAHRNTGKGALTAKRIPRASGVFIGTVNLQPITRESPLRQSASCRPVTAPNSRIKGM